MPVWNNTVANLTLMALGEICHKKCKTIIFENICNLFILHVFNVHTSFDHCNALVLKECNAKENYASGLISSSEIYGTRPKHKVFGNPVPVSKL